MNTQTIDLDLDKRPSGQVVYLGQRDRSSNYIKARITDNGEPLALSGLTVRLVILLPDGKTVYRVTPNTRSGNTATWYLSSNTPTSIPGRTDTAYVEIESGETKISTSRFSVVILDSAQK